MNLEAKGGGGSEGIGKLLDMDAGEVGALCHNHRMGDTVRPLPRTLCFWRRVYCQYKYTGKTFGTDRKYQYILQYIGTYVRPTRFIAIKWGQLTS